MLILYTKMLQNDINKHWHIETCGSSFQFVWISYYESTFRRYGCDIFSKNLKYKFWENVLISNIESVYIWLNPWLWSSGIRKISVYARDICMKLPRCRTSNVNVCVVIGSHQICIDVFYATMWFNFSELWVSAVQTSSVSSFWSHFPITCIWQHSWPEEHGHAPCRQCHIKMIQLEVFYEVKWWNFLSWHHCNVIFSSICRIM